MTQSGMDATTYCFTKGSFVIIEYQHSDKSVMDHAKVIHDTEKYLVYHDLLTGLEVWANKMSHAFVLAREPDEIEQEFCSNMEKGETP